MTDDLPLLIDRLRLLVDHPGDELGAVEHTLTDGYAHALALEAERRRAEARVRELAGDADALAEQRILKVAPGADRRASWQSCAASWPRSPRPLKTPA